VREVRIEPRANEAFHHLVDAPALEEIAIRMEEGEPGGEEGSEIR
jgi:hypothetical protein